MKTIALLATVAVAALFSTVNAEAANVGKLAGSYKGSGTVVDKRTAPSQVYKYTFSNVVVKVSKTGVISGSATVTAQISTMGGMFFPIGTQSATASGKVSKVKLVKSNLTATGDVVFNAFSQKFSVKGTATVSAKTGKGNLKINKASAGYTAAFTLKK